MLQQQQQQQHVVQACVHISTGVATTKTDRGGDLGAIVILFLLLLLFRFSVSQTCVWRTKNSFLPSLRKMHFFSLFLLSPLDKQTEIGFNLRFIFAAINIEHDGTCVTAHWGKAFVLVFL